MNNQESVGIEVTGRMTCRKAVKILESVETPSEELKEAIVKAVQIMKTQLRQLDNEKRKRMIGK